jgi:hypothetical protein
LSELHSDRVTDLDAKRRRDRAFKLFAERVPEDFYVKEPPPLRPPPRELPRTAAEWAAARVRCRQSAAPRHARDTRPRDCCAAERG